MLKRLLSYRYVTEQRRGYHMQHQSCCSGAMMCCEGATLFISTGCVRITVGPLDWPAVTLYVCSWFAGMLASDRSAVAGVTLARHTGIVGIVPAVVPAPSNTPGDNNELPPINREFCIDTIWTETLGRVGGGLIRFCFCRRLQNHTRTTSLSIWRPSASIETSSDVGFELTRKLFSSETRISVSILVRFLRRRLLPSGDTLNMFEH